MGRVYIAASSVAALKPPERDFSNLMNLSVRLWLEPGLTGVAKVAEATEAWRGA